MKIGFTGSRLDRADHLREDREAMAALKRHPGAGLLMLDGLDPVLDAGHRLSWAPLSEAPPGTGLAFLGLMDGNPSFAALSDVPHAASRSPGTMAALPLMAPDEAATYAAARSLVDWHSRHRFCAQCGGETLMVRAGWARQCHSCAAQHFPRTDPVVIMLAEHDDRVLLGRQPSFPDRFYSALAGFVEVGESVEDAVIRELKEEAGITAHSVRYVASQPWPFPSSLMIACVARTDDMTLTLDTNELEHAMWCDRAEVRAALDGDPAARFTCPPSFAIAHSLMHYWAEGGSS